MSCGGKREHMVEFERQGFAALPYELLPLLMSSKKF